MSGFEVAGVNMGTRPLLFRSAQSGQKVVRAHERLAGGTWERCFKPCLQVKRLLGQNSIPDVDCNRLLGGAWKLSHGLKHVFKVFDGAIQCARKTEEVLRGCS